MKPILALVAALFLLPASGCMSRYDIVMNNNVRVLSKSKPRLDKTTGVYHYTDVKGNKATVAAIRVREIGPHNRNPDSSASGY